MRPADRDRILAMLADVWDGHDYIPRVFEEWARDPGAWFQAAEVEGEVAGIQRLRPIGPSIVWYEGLRVATPHRRGGLARAMLAAGIEQAMSLGFRQIRLVTANPHAMRLFESAGFSLLVAPRRWQARRLEGAEPARLADSSQAERLARALLDDPALAGYGGVVPDGEWALEPDATLLARLANEGCLRITAGGRALAYVREGWSGEDLWAPFVSGSGAALRDLLMALRLEADTENLNRVSVWVYDGHPGEDDLRETGYDHKTDPFRLNYYGLRLDS